MHMLTEKCIRDAHVLSTPGISGHRLVRCKRNFSYLDNKIYKNNILRFNGNLLPDPAVLDTYQGAIENNLPPLPNEDAEANEILHHIRSAVNEVSENVLGNKFGSTDRDWITPEALVQIQQKHEICKQFGSKSVES